jgi:type VI secretion system secreted protein VgrG
MPDNKHLLTFHSDAVDDDTVHILELSGLEEISRYYVFTLDLVSKKADIDFVEILKKPARIEIKHGVKLAGGEKRGQQTLKIHGVLRSFEQVEQRLDWVRYKAELVPPLWKLSMNFQSRIFIEKTVPDIVKEILKEAGMAEGTDFEMKNLSGYPTREFVMQYEESDLDFIDRWLEHEGIFYFWEHSDQGSKMILANATAAYNPMQGTPTIAYNPITDTNNRVEAGESEKASDDWFREEIIPVFHCTQKVIPKKVILKEYNWRKPTDDLKVEHDVGKDGIGTEYEFNNHYKDTGQGDKLAEVRAQEHLCREIVYSGESDCRSFRAGATYTLEKHYRGDYNKEHLLTHVNHTASQTVELASNQTIDAKYRNQFNSVPGDQVFRPLRRTRWPSIPGFMSAKIDASGSGQYAEIDDMGRYKVKLPLDLSDKKDGKASRYVRMMQPYAGGGMGMHFPLHKGTEVALMFLDGDPDRPIIAGAIPNPDTASPVAGSNQTQCKIHTGGGNTITIEDQDGAQRMVMFSPTSNTIMTMGAPPPS